jgi:hypothetical protein
MNRLHIVHHGMGSFRPFRALFLILIGVLLGLGFAREQQCGALVWPKSYVPLQYRQVPPPSGAPAAPAAAPGSADAR